MSGSEKVDIHPCIEHGDHVKIVADVLVVSGLKYVRLVAHGPRCKHYPKEPLMDRIGML